MRRRDFLQMVGRAGGAGAVYQAMTAIGVLHRPLNEKLDLTGSGKGKKVLILGAGLAGMSAAWELRKLGYDCRMLEARGRPGGRAAGRTLPQHQAGHRRDGDRRRHTDL